MSVADRPSLLRCPKIDPHPQHEWLCPWETPTARWCPGVVTRVLVDAGTFVPVPGRVSWYFREGKPRVFTAMAQPDLGRPLNHS
jgi:hypothetical protein